MRGREVLRKGLIRRVGDGMKTEVWHDNWIEGTISMRPLGSLTDNSIHLVADLIDPVSGQWKEELIRNTFYTPDAEAILAMPRARRMQEDFWAWAWDTKGIYSVKSAYRVLADAQVDDQISEGTSRNSENEWKTLWKLRVLPKIRVFWWRVARGMLPCYGELHRRHIKTKANCPLCGCEEETLYHSLLMCDHARKFWDAGRLHFDIKPPKLHPNSWSMDILNPNLVKRDDAALMISIMWAIWHSRNKYTHGETSYQPWQSMALIDDIVRTLELPERTTDTLIMPRPKWCPPAEGWLKFNTDGATDEARRRGGAGMVVRNHAGEFILAMATRYDHIFDPLSLELLAIRDAVALAAEKGFQMVHVETDCKEIQIMWEAGLSRSRVSNILVEIRELTVAFQGFKLLYASRLCNGAAHLTAKVALDIENNVTNYDVIPGFLVCMLQTDMPSPNE